MAQGSNTATLRQRLEALPQELYDEIYDLTFTPDGGTRNISDTYRPPAQLQVSRATRLQFSKAYFGDGAVFRVQTEEVLGKWVRAFERQVLTLVDKIELCSSYQARASPIAHLIVVRKISSQAAARRSRLWTDDTLWTLSRKLELVAGNGQSA